MNVYHWPKDKKRIPLKSRAIAIGIFDGVHRGHRKILNQVLRGTPKRAAPTVVTFDPHPGKVLHPKVFHPTILMSLEHRLKVFERLGVRDVVVVRFNKKFSKMSHDTFLSEILVKKLGLRLVSVGDDFRFGHKGLGHLGSLKVGSRKLGFQVKAARRVNFKGKPISSTRIRQAIEKGNLAEAGQMLGRPVSVYGTVVKGKGWGRKLGFPTANLNPHHEALPPPGVYAARGILDKKPLKGVIHIGERPTFKDWEPSLEVHFFNFHKNIYGRDLELFFTAKLRSIRRFKGVPELSRAIAKDAARARKILDKGESARYNFSQL